MTDDHPVDELRCLEVVELLTAYLDGALPDQARTQVDEHLRDCRGSGPPSPSGEPSPNLPAGSPPLISPVSTRTYETAS